MLEFLKNHLVSISVLLAVLLITVIVFIANYKKRKHYKKEFRQATKDLQFTLPEKGNEFIRARLHTVLNENSRANDTQIRAFAKDYSLGYIKKLIALLRTNELSPADRIKTEEYAKEISAYISKTEWTGNDLQTVNELFSAVIKLSGKYAV